MQGIVGFEQLKLHCFIGAYPEEWLEKQDLYIDLRVRANFARCVFSDELEDTVDYIDFASIIKDVAEEARYKLLESFAHAALTKIVQHRGVEWAWIRVSKPKALSGASSGFIEMERSV